MKYNFETAVAVITLGISALLFALIVDGRVIRAIAGNISTDENLVPVGSVEMVEKNVRQKLPNSEIWVGALKSDQVFEGQSLYSGENSRAKINYHENTIELQSNTLVTLKETKEGLKMNIDFGSVEVKVMPNRPINIVRKGKLFKLESKEGGISKITTTDLGVEVEQKQGVVEIQEEKAPAVEVTEQTPLIMPEEKAVPISERKIEIVSPSPDQEIESTKPVIELSWSSIGGESGVDDVEIEIATNTNFDPVTKRIPTSKSREQISLPNFGHYYARFRDPKAKNLYSTVRQFKVFEKVEGEITAARSPSSTSEIDIAAPEIKALSEKPIVPVVVAEKAAGEVDAAKVEDTEAKSTEAEPTKVAVESKEVTAPPEPKSPALPDLDPIVSRFPRNFSSVHPIATENSRPTVILRWSPVPRAAHYEIQLSQNRDLSQLVENRTEKSDHMLVDKIPTGVSKLFWRVRYVTAETPKRKSKWSDVYEFNLVGNSGELNRAVE